MRPLHCIVLILCLACLGSPGYADSNREQADADLKAVLQQVESLQQDVADQQRKQSKATQDLARLEKAEQSARNELGRIRKQQKDIQARQAALKQQAAEQERQLAGQRSQLSEQLRVTYINGQEEWLRMSLSQQDPAQLGRQQAFYGYLSEARARLVAAVREELVRLAATRAEIDAAAAAIAELETNAEGRLAEVAATRQEREKLLAALAADISSKGAELETLRAQENKLRELVIALDKMLAELPVSNAEPFAGQTSSLLWPADGRVLHQFGQPRADGRLTWQGVLIGAEQGAEVRAVYHGRVVFADWLDGMGLLLIVEHGDGYMSLYGHNQALLKEVGQAVASGDAIAEVGDSGGQATPGLYFEIRKNGAAMNPSSWIK